jgi:thiosulfate/3-mercaptopyruvate sulfurtransferase
MKTNIISVEWLKFQRDVIIFDASLKPSASYIPGAIVFDFDKEICDQNSTLPHMMPSMELFQEEVQKLGVNQDSFIVVYDNEGIFSSARVWWMFRSMGHEKVAILDGGLPEWIAAGLPTEAEPSKSKQKGNFKAVDLRLFCQVEEVERALESSQVQVIDARSKGRFAGTENEPRPGLRSGHMPGSINLPFKDLLNGYKMKGVDELRSIFQERIPNQTPLIFSCGSGVTACIVCLAAELIGLKNLKVYDGSWSEWGLPTTRPVTTGDK